MDDLAGPDPVRIELDTVFDLHSVPDRDVRAVVEEYLEHAIANGWPAVRIIHGRGIGVRREIVRRLLDSRPEVADFKDAPLEAGGWGATVVLFRPRPTAFAAADPL